MSRKIGLTILCEILHRDGQTPVFLFVNAPQRTPKNDKNAVKPYNIRVCEVFCDLKKWVKIGVFLGVKKYQKNACKVLTSLGKYAIIILTTGKRHAKKCSLKIGGRKNMKVEQFYNRNQFHIWDTTKAVDYLQSYNSLVVKVEIDTTQEIGQKSRYIITLGRDWDYSTTTSKHVYLFLEEYGGINFDGVKNKRQYVNRLIQDGFIREDWSMR